MFKNLVSGVLVLILRIASLFARIAAALLIGFALIWVIIGAFASGWSGVIKAAYIPMTWAIVAWVIHMVATALIAKLGGGAAQEDQAAPGYFAGQPMATHSYLKIYPDGHVEQITIGTTAYGNNPPPPGGHRTETIIEHVQD